MSNAKEEMESEWVRKKVTWCEICEDDDDDDKNGYDMLSLM